MSECDCSWKTYKFNVCFRDQTLTGKAGEVLLREFVARIGLPELIDAELHLKQRERGDPESETVLSLCWNAILGGSFLLDLNVLRGDAGLRELLGVQSLMAPTTAGEFLRRFHIGSLDDLQRINRRAARCVRPWQTSAQVAIDLDALLYEQCSKCRQGSRMNYKGKVGYYPLLAFWAEKGEMLQTHLQAGNAGAAPQAVWFLQQALMGARIFARRQRVLHLAAARVLRSAKDPLLDHRRPIAGLDGRDRCFA
ncbi:MAG: transposase [Acidobacteria bacterium]|nr:transposase [Acidobacteriota bacterium]